MFLGNIATRLQHIDVSPSEPHVWWFVSLPNFFFISFFHVLAAQFDSQAVVPLYFTRLKIGTNYVVRNLDSSFSVQQVSVIIQQLTIPPHVLSGISPALPQSKWSILKNGHTHFLSFSFFLSFYINSNVVWDRDRASRNLYKLWESRPFLHLLNELLKESNLLNWSQGYSHHGSHSTFTVRVRA